MTNTKLLLARIEESGYKQSYIAKQLGLSVVSLRSKIENKKEFKASEINTLCKLLNIATLRDRDRIFFTRLAEEL